ncbi:MAG: ribosome biogenesis GTP-binding protein YihA/YsxC [Burkholderiales bacterium]|nr:YihA family ribosome biogenesis GTP-binding protein [Burkholderiales bacterium]MDQ3194938.1 ribosome biogenesis GTP-binding protein YihA/YsxC [Pseudomonadota bacterium]
MSVFRQATFFTTVNDLASLPRHDGVEIAFAGRSNAGKSSAINTLADHNRLAFVSKTPGRTQHINYFSLGEDRYLVDLPGYGYAKVPAGMRAHWEHLLGTYLQTRACLNGLVLIMDARHPMTVLDQKMLSWFVPTGKPVHVLLTKADKLSRNQAHNTLSSVQHSLASTYQNCTAQLFSSLAKTGVQLVEQVAAQWLGIKELQAATTLAPAIMKTKTPG